METKQLWEQMLTILQKDVIPATGCTEPIALALAAAVATRELGEQPERIEARVSPNIMKNGMGVIVPGTDTAGLHIAAAVGALGGDPEAGLQVLRHLSAEVVTAAQQMLADEQVTVAVAEVPHILYAEAQVVGGGHVTRVCIAGSHTNIIRVEKDGVVLREVPLAEMVEEDPTQVFLHGLTAQAIYDFATQIPWERIAFLKRAAELNDALAAAGLTGAYGLHLGASLHSKIRQGFVGNDLLNQIVMHTTAASDARMGGAPMPAMTNSGSGNQGITATEPVSVVARHVQATEEDTLRALALSHMMAIYIHGQLPKLSALCAVATAAMGAAAGMTWLIKKDFDAVCCALSSMVGDLLGMICDGAGNSCAMKVGTAASSAARATLLAMDNTRVTGHEGIVSHDIDESIRNIGALACKGMQQTDVEILQIMLNKNKTAKLSVK